MKKRPNSGIFLNSFGVFQQLSIKKVSKNKKQK
jgi:hypothetical protein